MLHSKTSSASSGAAPPHHIWNNYYASSLGILGGASVARPSHRRIMALGNSYLYGMVAYPRTCSPFYRGIASP